MTVIFLTTFRMNNSLKKQKYIEYICFYFVNLHSEMPLEVFSGGIYNWTALASINELSEKILSKKSPA